MKEKKTDKVYIVGKGRGQSSGKKSGGQVTFVDKRLKKDKRAMKAIAKRGKKRRR